MSLKTLLFSILTTLLIILLGATFIAVFNNEKQDIQTELYNNSKNVAQSLSLSLTNAKGDKVLMETMINAVFDGGHFNKIILTNNNNHIIYKRIKEIHEYNVPKWFKTLIKITAPTANADVSDGWRPVGILYVQNDVEYAYDKLFKIFIQLLIIYISVTIISVIILKIILDQILKPLEEIKNQAQAIINKEFKIIKKLPFITELKEVTLALNKMVEKIKIMFENANKEIIKLKQKEYIDPLTGLKNRKYYIERLNSIINNEENILEGMNIFISLKNLEEANKKLGRLQTDNLIKELTQNIQTFLKTLNNQNIIFARLNGSEFVIFIPIVNSKEKENFLHILKEKIQKTIRKYTTIIEPIIGAITVNSSMSLEEILSNTDKAVAMAELNQEKISIIKSKPNNTYSKKEWKKILDDAINNNLIDFLEYNAINMQNKQIHHKTLSICLKKENKILKYSEFIPAAIHLDMIDEIYKKALEKLIKSNFTFEKYSFKLSLEFLSKTTNFLFLKKLLKNKKTNFKLILEIPEKFIIEDFNSTTELIKIFNENLINFGIYNFIAESNNLNYISELHPDFIKSDKNFYISQSDEILTHLKNIAITTETDLIATGVNEEKYLNILEKKGIFIIQGSITNKFTGN